MPRALFASASAALLLGACASDKVIGRYQSAICSPDPSTQSPCHDIVPTASAFAMSIPTPSSGATASGVGFPERALAAYVNVLGRPDMSATPAALRANLAGALGGGSSSGPDDRTVVHRTLVVTVRKDPPFNPADRLEATDVTIRLAGAKFVGWDTLATAYTTINAGTVQFTAVRGLTESLSAPSGVPAAVGATLGASQSDTRAETLAVTQQAETLSADVEDGGRVLDIHRQGGLGVDLTGNTVVKVDIAYDGNPSRTVVSAIGAYHDKAGAILAPGHLALTQSLVLAPPPKADVKAKVDLTYTVRHILAGDGTYEEKDDRVQEITRTSAVANDTPLVPARDFSPTFFGLHAEGSAHGAVGILRPGGALTGLCFGTYDEAGEFLAWLRIAKPKDPSVLAEARIGFNPVPPSGAPIEPLRAADVAGLQVRPSCIA